MSELLPKAFRFANASFEQNTLSDGGWAQGTPGWNFSGLSGGEFNPTTASYASGNGTDGANVAYLNSGISMSQTLATTFSNNNHYQLLVDIGSQLEFADDAVFTVRLYAGTTVIGTYTNAVLDPGAWGTVRLDVSGASFAANNGQSLKIEIENVSGTKVNVDNVRLTTTTATASIAENSVNGTAIATAIGLDRDPSNTLTYSLTNTAGGRFAIDANTGAITVANGSLFDFEAASSHTITVRTTDQGSATFERTFTINLTNVNEGPSAVSDTATAIEAGGTANGTAGTNPTGNVLTNDTDVDTGDTKTVTGVSAGVQASAAGSVASAVTGSFGSINIAADGSYTYTVDNNNAAVQALRTTANTLQDVFTYTMRDTAGLTSTTQITVTIQGANDAPSDLALANPIGTNLITNGSFETNNGAANTFTWGAGTTVSGWTAIGGEGFEIWNNYNNDGPATASQGNSRLELNVGGGAINGISQSISTVNGQTYVLSFDLASRTSMPNSEVQVYWRGELVGTIAQTAVAWQTHSFVVTGSGGSDELRFMETATNNASGSSLLDNVRLTAENNPAIAVAENAANGTVVALAGARDVDNVSMDTRTFSLTNTAGGRFAIDATTGIITLPMDRCSITKRLHLTRLQCESLTLAV